VGVDRKSRGHGLPRRRNWGRAGSWRLRRETMDNACTCFLWRRKRKKAGCPGRNDAERRGKKKSNSEDQRISGILVHEPKFSWDPKNSDIV